MVVVICVLAGLAVGVLLERVIVRVPERDRARRVPVLAGWRPGEREAIARWRHPVVVPVTTAAVFGVLAGRFHEHGGILTAHLVLGASVVCVSFVDIDTLRIPDRLTFPSLGAAVVAVGAVSLAEGEPGWLIDAGVGAAAFFGLLLVFNLVYPAGMGFGDVKYALVLGWYLGWSNPLLIVYALLAASLIGTVAGVAVMAVNRGERRAFPFGPGLCAGTILALVLAETLLP